MWQQRKAEASRIYFNKKFKLPRVAQLAYIHSFVSKHGILNSIWLAFRYALRRTIGLDITRVILLERSLEEPIREVVPKIEAQFEQATQDDLYKFEGIVDKDKYRSFQQRFKKGGICIMAQDGAKVVAFSWMIFNYEYVPDCAITVKLTNNKVAYFFDDYVLPIYRNKLLQSALLTERLKYLKINFFEKAISLVWNHNVYSLKAYASAGFRPKTAVTLFRIFGLKFHRWRNIPVLHQLHTRGICLFKS